MNFEEKVEKIIEEYRAPQSITDEIKEFLLNSGNVYAICITYIEENEKSSFYEILLDLLAYDLEKHGATVLPKGKTNPFKYEVFYKNMHLEGYIEIEIWNKHVNNTHPLVCVCLDEDGKETYSNVSGFYPFNVSSEKIFAHYRELERLLREAKHKISEL